MPTVRDADGKSSQRIPFIDLDVLERKKKVDMQPTMHERAHADPCTALMGLEPLHQFYRDAGRR